MFDYDYLNEVINKNLFLSDFETSEYVKCITTNEQNKLLQSYVNNKYNLIVKRRHCGNTTLTKLYVALLMTHVPYQQIFYITPGDKFKLINDIKCFINLKLINKTKSFKSEYNKLEINNSKLCVFSNIVDGRILTTLRGYRPTLIIIDDYYENIKDINDTIIVFGDSCKFIITSTPVNNKGFFYNLYNDSIKKKNSFIITNLNEYWNNLTRKNKVNDFYLFKMNDTDDIIDTLLESEYNNCNINSGNYLHNGILEYFLTQGYWISSHEFINRIRTLKVMLAKQIILAEYFGTFTNPKPSINGKITIQDIV